MKCPNCQYEEGRYIDGKYIEPVDYHGQFWHSDGNTLWNGQKDFGVRMYGCPKCKFVFHDG